jgi:GH35 family endo-1,4-beta-xylanase
MRKGRIAADTAADTISVQSTLRSSFGTRFARIALAGVVTAGLGLPTTPVTASADAPFGFVGVNAEEVTWASGAVQDEQLALMQAHGITELRVIVRWSYIEQVRGVYNWSLIDAITLAAARHNIRVLPIVGGETAWASSRPPSDERRCLFPPADNQTFAGFMRLVVARYGPGGELWRAHPEVPQYPLTSWQIWNEQNTDTFWACKRSAAAYTELARVTANAIHDVDPDAAIITGGAPNKHGGDYLREMMKNGARKVFDGIALHPYKKDADAIVAEVKKARELLNDLDAKRWKIRVTEFGWATSGPFHKTHSVDEAKQARLIRNTLTKLAAQRDRLKLTGVAYYAWRDAPPPTDVGGGSDYWGLHTGLLRLDATPKPALNAVLEASRAIK